MLVARRDHEEKRAPEGQGEGGDRPDRDGSHPRDRGVARQGEDDPGLPRSRLRGRGLGRAHPRPAQASRRHPGQAQGRGLVPARRRRGPRLHRPVRRRRRQADEGRRAEEEARRRRRPAARDGRGPRGRGHRVAPARGAAAEGAGQADGLPRDHQGRDPPRGRGHPRPRPGPRRRPGDPAHPRPALRLRGLAGAVEEGHDRPVRRPRPVGRHASRRRPRAGADRVPGGVVLGHRGAVRPRLVQREARRGRRPARRHGQGLQRPRRAHPRRRGAPDRGDRRVARGGPAGRAVHRALGGGQALPPVTGRAVHDLHAPAGGEPQAALGRAAHDARRAGPLRARLHHLHAYRLHDAVRVGGQRRARAGR